jgi:hypothetical protein
MKRCIKEEKMTGSELRVCIIVNPVSGINRTALEQIQASSAPPTQQATRAASHRRQPQLASMWSPHTVAMAR